MKLFKEKMGYFIKSSITICEKVLNFVTLKMGIPTLTGHPVVLCDKFVIFCTDFSK